MVIKKSAFKKLPTNVAAEKLRIQQDALDAQDQGDVVRFQELKRELDSLEAKVKDNAMRDVKLEQFTSLNAKNRDINYKEGREAEKAAIQAKKEKGVSFSM